MDPLSVLSSSSSLSSQPLGISMMKLANQSAGSEVLQLVQSATQNPPGVGQNVNVFA